MSIRAQGWGGWFNQKQTQTKYLIKQIAALQVYLHYLEKGYAITEDGLHLIGDLKNGEFNLHKSYFSSLKTVNPNIMKYPKIAAMLSMQMGIINNHYSVTASAKESQQFSMEEVNYIKKVYENLEDEAEKDLDELQLVIKNGQMQMTDDERISEIDKIYNRVQDKYSFSKKFSDKIKMLIEQRKQIETEAQQLKRLYDGQ
jgi:DNA repair ATPase RecN